MISGKVLGKTVNPLSLAIAGTLFIIGLWVGRTSTSFSLPIPNNETRVTQTPEPQPSQIIASVSATVSPLVTMKPINTPMRQNTTSPKQSTELNRFNYPNGTIQNSSENSYQATTTDEPDRVTSWYESTLKFLGFSSTSVAKTNSNDRIENKLAGRKNGEQITITVTRQPDQNVTSIKVERSFTDSNSSNVKIEIRN